MAKRRFRATSEAPVETLSPEERRALRKKERAKRKAGDKPKGVPSNPWRRALLLAIPVAVIVAVVLVFAFSNLFKTPCLNFSPIPQQSGVPAFPPHNTTDFSQTWCPQNANLVFHVHPYLKISIQGTMVGIPPTQAATSSNPDWPSIGRNSSYPGGYECDLPIHTHPPVASAGYPDGIIHLESPWAYDYNLSNFFSVWSQSFPSVNVNGSFSAQPIVYQTNDILGFRSDATHTVTLYVDNQPSSAGPDLTLNTLDYAPSPSPSCIGEVYGTGHVILISYAKLSPAMVGSGLHPATLSTQGADPMLYLTAHGGTLEKVPELAGHSTGTVEAKVASLLWLSLRADSA